MPGAQAAATLARLITVEEVRGIAAIPDPVVRNLEITQAYYELSLAMAQLTGPGANWCTIATWASKQAGQSIREEDLRAAFERLMHEASAAQTSARTLLAYSAEVAGDEAAAFGVGDALATLWDAINPAGAFARTSAAVARGNVKVFEEIGAEFARFLALWQDGAPGAEKLAAFNAGLREGEPPDGQERLRRAFAHYAAAIGANDGRSKAQLLLLANLEIGLHEQTRLQGEILEAMNAPVVHPRALRARLVAQLFPDTKSRIRFWLGQLGGQLRQLIDARDQLADEAQRVGRQVVSAALMTLRLPRGRVLLLGEDLPAAFPPVLSHIDLPELAALLAQVDPTPDSPRGTGATDWSRLAERMHYIADLFRAYHLAPELFDPPFDSLQVAAIRRGERPSGPL